jgi:hypothetical protein
MRKAINACLQRANESFATYLDRFRGLLIKCPHHGIPLWRQCQIIYEGMSMSARALLEARCQGDFTSLSDTEAWELFEELAARTMNWEEIASTQDPKGDRGVLLVNPTKALEAKVAALTREIELLKTSQPKGIASCVGCNEIGHVVEECPMLQGQHSVEVNAAFARLFAGRNDPFSNTYNPGWKHHPNFSWRGQGTQEPTHAPHSQPAVDKVDSIAQSVEKLTKTVAELAQTVKEVYPLVMANSQSLAGMRPGAGGGMDREIGSLPNQPIPNPRLAHGHPGAPSSSK